MSELICLNRNAPLNDSEGDMVNVFPAMTLCVDYATRAYIDLASAALLYRFQAF